MGVGGNWGLTWGLVPSCGPLLRVHVYSFRLHSFAACFEATVRGNPDPKTNHLVFDLRGEGTLPRVSVVTPQDKLPSGERHVSFGRVFLGKSQVRYHVFSSYSQGFIHFQCLSLA